MTAPKPSGFLTANVATALARDPKVRAAARAGGWEAVAAYVFLLLATWEAGEQLHVADAIGALPRDFPELSPELLAILDDVGLTAGGHVPDDAFAKHYGTARDRSDRRAAGSAKGGDATKAAWAARPKARPKARPSPRLDHAQADRQTDDDTIVSSVGLSSVVPPANGAGGPPTIVRVPADVRRGKRAPVVLEDAVPPPRHASGRTWANGTPCTDYDHAWTHVMTPAGMVCRTCSGDAATT